MSTYKDSLRLDSNESSDRAQLCPERGPRGTFGETLIKTILTEVAGVFI